jgi:hypothetical protein
MVVGYFQNGYPNEAINLFQKKPEQDVVSWKLEYNACGICAEWELL